ncbi:MAG TPA: arginine--tRNA ligase [Patescibacteria group bacterium]
MRATIKDTETKSYIKELISQALAKCQIEYNGEINPEHPSDNKFGDYSTNAAMAAAKLTKQNPVELANKIKEELQKLAGVDDIIQKIEVAGAGFINFYLTENYLVKKAESYNYEAETRNRLADFGGGRTMVIDYSAPNIAKPFGIGHLRSTNIGQAIYNIYKILGWRTIGDNHLGDWGTQFGKLIVAIKRWGEKPVEEMTIDDLEKLYVKFHQEAENEPSLTDEARETFAKLENGDTETKTIWQKCIDLSIKEFDRVYEILGVHIDHSYGESFYEKMLPQVIEDFKNKNLTKDSEGALIVEYDNMPPAMLLKSNKTTTYFTRDMATIKFRKDTWNPDLIVYEVGNDHILHFNQVFRAAEMMDWQPKEGFVHVAHGMIRWANGKFSTREGKTIHMAEVLQKAEEEAKKVAENSQVGKEMSATEREEMIKAVAIGAVKFTDLSQDPKKDIIFDWERIMSLEGDSGPYLQYTYARCLSVLNKSDIKEQKNTDQIPKTMKPEELQLLKEFYRFDEKIAEAADRFNPSIIAEFLLSVARKYNEFYAKCKIIGDNDEVFRIFLTRTTASILKSGMEILGINTVEKM